MMKYGRSGAASQPDHFPNPCHPIGALMEATIAAREADPERAAPVHHLHGSSVITAKILGGDDGNRQNLRV